MTSNNINVKGHRFKPDEVISIMKCKQREERINNFVNNVNNDIDNLEERINNFTYRDREEVNETSQAYKFLKSVWRDIKLKKLLSKN